jgi:hypothetical protein
LATKVKSVMADLLTFSPRTIYDASGRLEGIILGYDEYRALLRLLADHVDIYRSVFRTPLIICWRMKPSRKT